MNLENYYQSQILPGLEKLELNRQQAVKNIKLCWMAILLGAATIALVLLVAGEDAVFARTLPGALFALGVVAVILGLIVKQILSKKLRKGLKQALVAPVCHYFGYNYQPKGFTFPLDRFTDCGIVARDANKISMEDCISGKENNVTFKLCEASLVKETTDTNNEKQRQLLFSGLLLIYSFPKSFTGDTRIIPRTWRKGYLRAEYKGERVILEDPEFTALFNVYSTDQIESRYILTPGFMQRIKGLAEHFSEAANKISFGFNHNDLIIALQTNKNRFEGGGLNTSFLFEERLNALVRELELIKDIITVLNLTDTSNS